ncbi:MAG: VWA domain-containing protein [Opitutales bacterium]
MNLFLANPWGLLALLGLPTLVVIHFFQRRSRRVEVSTLFLIEDQRLESRTGRRFERWRGSRSFWLQVLAVLLLTWFLIQPRWIREDTLQRVVIVVDNSFSMQAFKPELLARTDAATRNLEDTAARTQWLAMPSDLDAPGIYQGSDRDALMEALRQWQPTTGAHDYAPALRLARTRAGVDGRLILISDHAHDALDPSIERLAIGSALENSGFAGGSVTMVDGRPTWRVFLRNYGTESVAGAWSIELEGTAGRANNVRLDPGKGLEISGVFPTGANTLTLLWETAQDGLSLDNRIALAIPQPKPLAAGIVQATGPRAEFLERLARSLPERVAPATLADAEILVRFAEVYPENQDAPPQIVFYGRDKGGPPRGARRLGTAENHPLMEGLAWQGLIAALREGFEARPGDEVLLWFEDTPAIFLRPRNGRRDLVFNFDPAYANLARLPAFVLLAHRFANEVRAGLPRPETLNAEAGQPLVPIVPNPALPVEITRTLGGETRTEILAPERLLTLRAPAQAGTFAITQNGQRLLDGAVQFADSREADLTRAASENTLEAQGAALREANSSGDSLAGLWLLLAGAALLGAWWAPRPTA